MPLKVIGAGEGRTGTMSLKVALEQLGFGPCYHMTEVVMHPERGTHWVAAIEGRPDWEGTFAGYVSAVDAPTCEFWREIAAFYPQAKVILTEREPQSWFDSTQATIFSENAHRALAATPLSTFFEKFSRHVYGDPVRVHDRDFMIERFLAHNAAVKREIPRSRLLVYDVKAGWEPLCRFLDVPVPDAPFPRVNTRADMRAMFGARKEGEVPPLENVRELLRGRVEKD